MTGRERAALAAGLLLGGAAAAIAMWRSTGGTPTSLWFAPLAALGAVGVVHPDAFWWLERLELSLTARNWRTAEPSRIWRLLNRAGGVVLLAISAAGLFAPSPAPEPAGNLPDGVCLSGPCGPAFTPGQGP